MEPDGAPLRPTGMDDKMRRRLELRRSNAATPIPAKRPAGPNESEWDVSDQTIFKWPAQDGEQEVHEIETIADGVVDASGSFVRTFWAWGSTSSHLVQIRAQIDGRTASQGITVSTLRRWIRNEVFGSVQIHIDGHRCFVPVSYLSILLRQIDWFAAGQPGAMPR